MQMFTEARREQQIAWSQFIGGHIVEPIYMDAGNWIQALALQEQEAPLSHLSIPMAYVLSNKLWTKP